jgi:hypothetical protein
LEKFYIYLHKTADTLETFYVGKGKDNRAWSIQGRSKFWNRVKDRHGLIVELVSTGLSEQDAFSKEKELIKFYGRRDRGEGSLVNLTDGGEGVSGLIWSDENRAKFKEFFKGENHPNYRKDIFTFYNFETDVEVKMTRFFFKEKYPKTDINAMLKGISSKGWVIMEAVDEAKLEAIISGYSGKFNHHADPKIYNIVNLKTGDEEWEIVFSGVFDTTIIRKGIVSPEIQVKPTGPVRERPVINGKIPASTVKIDEDNSDLPNPRIDTLGLSDEEVDHIRKYLTNEGIEFKDRTDVGMNKYLELKHIPMSSDLSSLGTYAGHAVCPETAQEYVLNNGNVKRIK